MKDSRSVYYAIYAHENIYVKILINKCIGFLLLNFANKSINLYMNFVILFYSYKNK